MPGDYLANRAETALTAAVATAPAAGTSESWQVAASANLPSVQTRVRADDEILLVTAKADATHITVTRGAEGTTPTTHANGTAIRHVMTAAGLDNRYLPFALNGPPSVGGDIPLITAFGPGAIGVGTQGKLLTVDTSGYPGWVEPVCYDDPIMWGAELWNYDGAQSATSGAGLTNGVVYLHRLLVTHARTVSNIHLAVITAGATLTSGQCLAGLYDSAGTRLQVSATQHTNWQSTGFKTIAITSTALSYVGIYWVATLHQGTTAPQFLRAPFTGTVAGLMSGSWAASSARWGSILTGQTSLPATITPASIAYNNTGTYPWVGLS